MATSRSVEDRVTRAAEDTLTEQHYVTAIDVLLRLGWLAASHVDLWRQGRLECLEEMVQAGPAKQLAALHALRTWAARHGLTPSETEYTARTRDRRALRFSVSGHPDIRTSNGPTARTGCPRIYPSGRPNGCGPPRTSRPTWWWCHRCTSGRARVAARPATACCSCRTTSRTACAVSSSTTWCSSQQATRGAPGGHVGRAR